jgi:hypothetical protein
VNEQPSLTEIVGGTVMLAGLAIAVIVRAPWRIQDARPESAALVGFETLGTEILNPELATDDSA